jgi:porin
MASAVGAIFPFQWTALPEQAYLTQLTVERKAPVGGVGLKVGWMSLDPDLFLAPAYEFYGHSALDATYNINVAGYPVSPNSGAAALLTYRPSEHTELRYGIYDMSNNLQLNSYGALAESAISNLQGTLQVLQVQHRWEAPDRRLKQRKVEGQLPDGLLQIGGFLSNSKATPLEWPAPGGANPQTGASAALAGPEQAWMLPANTPAANPGIVAGPSQGAYGNLTVPIELPFGLAHRLYGGMLTSFSPATNPVSLYGQVGWLAQGLLPSRPQDVLVLGYGRSVFSPVLGLQDESVLELGYRIMLGRHLTLQPTVQWIFNPGGQGQLSTVTTAGMQIELQF